MIKNSGLQCKFEILFGNIEMMIFADFALLFYLCELATLSELQYPGLYSASCVVIYCSVIKSNAGTTSF